MKRWMVCLLAAALFFAAANAEAPQFSEKMVLAEGTAAETPLYIFDSGVERPTLLLVAGTHGNEDGGYRAAEILLESLQVTKGRVLLVPHANRRAIDAYTRTGPDGVDMNRSYPGDPEGNDIEVLAHEIIGLIEKYVPDAVIDMHEGRNFYGVDGSIGNSVVVGMTPGSFAHVLDILEYVNANNEDRRPFTYDANAPEGSLNHEASAVLGVDAYTIETPQVYELDIRVEQQLVFVRAFFDAYGVEATW